MPVLEVETNKIFTEVSNIKEGMFHIKNTSGGTLEGTLTSDLTCLDFSDNHFKGNDVRVIFKIINEFDYPIGETIHSEILISSNGGEKKIQLLVKFVLDTITTKEGFNISDIKDFYNYSKKFPIEARRLLGDNGFILWLKSTGFEHIDILEYFIQDSNKERAIDNFFILSKIKNKSYITTDTENIKFKINPFEKKIISGSIKLNKVGLGFIDYNVILKNKSSWLDISNSKISSKCFDDDDFYNFKYEIRTDMISRQFESEKLIFQGEKDFSINIDVVKLSPVKIVTDRLYFEPTDMGFIHIINNTKSEVIAEVTTADNFIKFSSNKFNIIDSIKIPFVIKITTIHKTQMELLKRPYLESKITAKVVINDYAVVKEFKITIGNLLSE